MPKHQQSNPFISLAIIFLIVLVVGLAVTSCLSLMGGPARGFGGNVAVIDITGELSPDSGGFFGGGLTVDDYIDLVREADENPSIEAILLRINSPGGTPVASEELMAAVRDANKTTIALIRDQATSGAYWVASAADEIVASPVSITGSIGVIGSSLEFSGFMDKYGIGYERLVAGEFKDAGIPFRNLTIEERALLQERLDRIHEYFISSVAENRGMAYEEIAPLASGLIYTGDQAFEIGLIDRLGGEREAEDSIRQLTGVEEISYVEYEVRRGFFDSLAGVVSGAGFSVGEGIGSSLVKSSHRIAV